MESNSLNENCNNNIAYKNDNMDDSNHRMLTLDTTTMKQICTSDIVIII
jgi:hypothetical protein